MTVHRRTLLTAASGLALAPWSVRAAAPSGEPLLVGVSGPLSGPAAQYGAQWKKGFDLAIDEINGAGGVIGRPLAYVFEDSQSDPRQSVSVAQKYVNDPRILMEVGDFASPASMAASPIYQRAKLVQFGFTNSHPDFTKGGDYMWSTSNSQADEQPNLARYAIERLGMKRVAVLFLNTDWGRTSKDVFAAAAKSLGAEVVAAEGYQPTEQDFRPTLVRVRDAKPDGIILLSYYADAALIARQAADSGLKLPMAAASSVYSPKLIELGGAAVDGLFLTTVFFPEEQRPEVQKFVGNFRAKYGTEPDTFNAGAYDVMYVFKAAVELGGPTRAGVRKALAEMKGVPSVIFGEIAFNTETRRVPKASYKELQIKAGKFVMWDGKKPIA
jgi:branched-chain amino acid transport system substrate-binding protein